MESKKIGTIKEEEEYPEALWPCGMTEKLNRLWPLICLDP